jgi:outer membrane protein OmpA-like peptidoglycan-associated protein
MGTFTAAAQTTGLNPGRNAALDAMAAVMRAYTSARFLIEGHTCDLGGERDNIDLSWSRAEAVIRRLRVARRRMTYRTFTAF